MWHLYFESAFKWFHVSPYHNTSSLQYCFYLSIPSHISISGSKKGSFFEFMILLLIISMILLEEMSFIFSPFLLTRKTVLKLQLHIHTVSTRNCKRWDKTFQHSAKLDFLKDVGVKNHTKSFTFVLLIQKVLTPKNPSLP